MSPAAEALGPHSAVQRERRSEGHQQRSKNHLGAELRTQHPAASLGQQLKEIAEQDKRERDKQQEDQRRERSKDQRLLHAAGPKESQVKGLLRNQHEKEQENSDPQADDQAFALAGFRFGDSGCHVEVGEIIGQVRKQLCIEPQISGRMSGVP